MIKLIIAAFVVWFIFLMFTSANTPAHAMGRIPTGFTCSFSNTMYARSVAPNTLTCKFTWDRL